MPLIKKKEEDIKRLVITKERKKSLLVPRIDKNEQTPKKSKLIPKKEIEATKEEEQYDEEIVDKPINEPTIKLRPKRNREKYFNKWIKLLESGSLECARLTTGRTHLRIVFNPEIEHFSLQFVDTDNSVTNFKTTFPVSVMEAMRAALRRIEKAGLIRKRVAMAPMPEDEEVTAR